MQGIRQRRPAGLWLPPLQGTWPTGIQAPLMDVGDFETLDFVYLWAAPGYDVKCALLPVCRCVFDTQLALLVLACGERHLAAASRAPESRCYHTLFSPPLPAGCCPTRCLACYLRRTTRRCTPLTTPP